MPEKELPAPSEDEETEFIEDEETESDTEPLEAAAPDTSKGPDSGSIDREADTRPVEAISPDGDTKPNVPVRPPGWVKVLDAACIVLGLGLLVFSARLSDQVSPPLPRLVGPPAEMPRRIRAVSDEPGGQFRLANGAARSLTWDSSGKRLAVGGSEGHVEVWDLETEKPKFVLESEGEVFALAFGTWPNRESPEEEDRKDYLFSLHGRYGRGGYGSCRLVVWNLENGQRRDRYEVPLDLVTAAGFSSDGRTLALASVEQVALCDLGRTELVRRDVSCFRPSSLAVGGTDSRDVLIGEYRGAVLLVGSHEDISQRKLFYGSSVRTAVALAGEGRMAAVGFSAEFEAGRSVARPIRAWPDWQQWDDGIQELEGPLGEVLRLHFEGREALLAFCLAFDKAGEKVTRKPSVVGWQLSTGTRIGAQVLASDVSLCEFSPDGKWMALARAGGLLELREVRLE